MKCYLQLYDIHYKLSCVTYVPVEFITSKARRTYNIGDKVVFVTKSGVIFHQRVLTQWRSSWAKIRRIAVPISVLLLIYGLRQYISNVALRARTSTNRSSVLLTKLASCTSSACGAIYYACYVYYCITIKHYLFQLCNFGGVVGADTSDMLIQHTFQATWLIGVVFLHVFVCSVLRVYKVFQILVRFGLHLL
jgi:hypothetical protein